MTRDEYKTWNRLYRLVRAQEMKARGHGHGCFIDALVCLNESGRSKFGQKASDMLLFSSHVGVANRRYIWISSTRSMCFSDLKQKRAAA